MQLKNNKIVQTMVFIILIVIYFPVLATESNSTSLPLMQITDLEYQGAFIIPSNVYGESRADDVAGPMEYNPINHSMFFSGKTVDSAIAEFSIPTLVNSTTLSELNTGAVLQNFHRVLTQSPDGNPQNINRVTGLKLIDGRLIVNGVSFYDAPADNTHTTLVVEDASDITGSQISGYYELQGRAHVAGWISSVPLVWQDALGGEYLFGNAPNYSIASRYPQGVTAFIVDPALISGAPNTVIPTTTLLDFSLANPLYEDYSTYEISRYNILSTNGTSPFPGHTAADIGAVAGENNLWTAKSKVGYGFIVPNSRTYLTIGSSGGHVSGIGYKARQNGQTSGQCGGSCAYDADDYYNYYWLWDVNDLLAVKNGTIQAYDVRPYDSGVFNAPFQTDIFNGGIPAHHPINGGTYDPVSGLLYLTVSGGESTDQYGFKPLIVVYQINDIDVIFTSSFE